MNNVFRLVWNRTLGRLVVASEAARSTSKAGSSQCLLAGLVIGGLVSISSSVFAEVGTAGGTGNGTAISRCTGSNQANAVDEHNIAIGCNTTADGGSQFFDRQNPFHEATGSTGTLYGNVTSYSLAIGQEANSDGGGVAYGAHSSATSLAVAIGARAKASDVAGVAIGPAALAAGNTALAIGRQSAANASFAQAIGNVAAATGVGSLAMGHSATAEGYRAIAIGSADIENAGSTGDQAGVTYQEALRTHSTGRDSIALGGGAIASEDDALAIGAFSASSGERSVAIGTGSDAQGSDSVSIGQGSVTTLEGAVAVGQNTRVETENSAAIGRNSVATAPSGLGYLTNSATPSGVVSIGTIGDERRLQNVSAGSADTDAVNVSQLKVVNETANRGWDLTANGEAVGENIAPGETADFSEGKNIAITRTGNRIEVATADDVEFSNVDVTENLSVAGNTTLAGDLTVEGDTVLGNTSIANDTLVVNDGSLTVADNTTVNMGGNQVTNVA
ncbi:MAG: hypothetical protein JJT87_20835, partial [Halomonas sp.]